jgi:hypothetical protein
MQIVKYDGTTKEYDRIVAEKVAQGFTLTDVSNVTEGDFLGFKEPDEIKTPVQSSIETKLAALEAKIDSILVKQDEIKTEQLAAKQAVLEEKI